MWGEITFENVPQPADDPMTVVKTSVVLCVPPENITDTIVIHDMLYVVTVLR